MVDIARGHISEDLLERYAMQIATAEDISVIEQHLLVCEVCRDVLVHTEEFISAFRALYDDERRPIDFTHHTSSGPIRIRTQRGGKNGTWKALLSGHDIGACEQFNTVQKANAFLKHSFREMFPEHKCTRRCAPTEP
jgi:hypothetical protein